MATKYLYSLEVGSRKYTCPKCGYKTLVRFINNRTGAYLGDKYGRCDRENKCGYFLKPERKNLNEFSITPIWQMKETLNRYDTNILIQTLVDRFGIQAVNGILKKFYIGTGSDQYSGWTIFWQVDHQGYIRTGHMMKYNGLRRTTHQNWTHALTKQSYKFKQCLFGQNQIKDLPTAKQINVVESEKTALIGSIYFPNETWMATAGKHGLKQEALYWLYPHPVHLYPDNDSVDFWSKTAKGFSNVQVVDWQHDFFGYSQEILHLDKGSDIADFLILHKPEELSHFSLN